MRRKRNARRSPPHLLAVLLPIAVYVATFAAFAVYALTHDRMWWYAALGTSVAGCGSALVAVIPGLRAVASRVARRGTPRGAFGIAHTIAGAIALAFLACNLWLQRGSWRGGIVGLADGAEPDLVAAMLLSGAGVTAICVAGWLGWGLANRRSRPSGLTFAEEGSSP